MEWQKLICYFFQKMEENLALNSSASFPYIIFGQGDLTIIESLLLEFRRVSRGYIPAPVFSHLTLN